MKRIKAILVFIWIIFAQFSFSAVEAADYTWLGVTENWNDPQNWSSSEPDGSIPTASDNVIVNVTSPMVNPLISMYVEIANLTVDAGTISIDAYATLFVHGTVSISGSAKIAGPSAFFLIGESDALVETVTIASTGSPVVIEPQTTIFSRLTTLQNVSFGAISITAETVAISECSFGSTASIQVSGTADSIIEGPFTSTTLNVSNAGSGSVIFGNAHAGTFLITESASFYNAGSGMILFGNAADTDTFIFGNAATFTNTAAGSILFGSSASDSFTFNGAVTFNKDADGPIAVARFGTSEFFGAFTYNAPSGEVNVIGVAGGGMCSFRGNAVQIISGTGGGLSFNKLTINKTGNHVTLQTPVNLVAVAEAPAPNAQLNLLAGNIITSNNTVPARILTVPDGLMVSQNTDPNKSFVNGPMRKNGTSAFIFPVGKGLICRPIGISEATTTNAVTIQAEYFNTVPPNSTAAVNLTTAMPTLSACEYWQIGKIAGLSDVGVKLNWPLINCETVQTVGLRIGRYNATTRKWEAVPSTINETNREIVSNAAMNLYGNVTFGYAGKRIYVDTRGLDPLSFTITGAQLAEGINYTGNRLIPLLPVAPASGTSPITINIPAAAENNAMKIAFDINSASAISNVKASMDDTAPSLAMGSEFYTINNSPDNGKTIKFLRGDEVVTPVFTTNLVDGTVLNNSSGGIFQISGLTGFTITSFRILTVQNQLVKGPLTVAEWDGTDQNNTEVNNGVYKFELTITNASQSYTYQGQVIVR